MILQKNPSGVSERNLPCAVRLHTSSSAMAERPCELGDFKGVSHFEA